MKILTYPDKILDSQCKDVGVVDEEIEKLVNKMLDTMYENRGVGLAASQIGILKNILVFDCSDDQDQPQCLIDPEIANAKGEQISKEGCLSFPGITLDIIRSQKITVKAKDLSGESKAFVFEGLESACVQHEIDHLRGETLLNRVNRQTRRKVARLIRKK